MGRESEDKKMRERIQREQRRRGGTGQKKEDKDNKTKTTAAGGRAAERGGVEHRREHGEKKRGEKGGEHLIAYFAAIHDPPIDPTAIPKLADIQARGEVAYTRIESSVDEFKEVARSVLAVERD
jgi:hypothetical protein